MDLINDITIETFSVDDAKWKVRIFYKPTNVFVESGKFRSIHRCRVDAEKRLQVLLKETEKPSI